MFDYPFTQEEAIAAHREWGCNCGPSALAFALQIGLDQVRPLIPGFDEKRYTNGTMMRMALIRAGQDVTMIVPPKRDPDFSDTRPLTTEVIPRVLAGLTANAVKLVTTIHTLMFHERMALVRIQWTGRWTEPGANKLWALRHTHWIATWKYQDCPLLFDCNGGVNNVEQWQEEIVPLLTNYEGADGGWWPTHIWRFKGGRELNDC